MRHVGKLFVLAVLFLLVCVGSSYGAQYNWKFQAHLAAGTLDYRGFVKFTEDVKRMSGGRIEITHLPEGAVVASKEMLKAIRSRLLDGAFGSVGYYSGIEPAFGVLGDFTCGYDTSWQVEMAWEKGGLLQIARELYAKEGVYLIGGMWRQNESIPSRKPIRGVADFKGLKIRAPGGSVGKVFRAIGASVVTLPGSELFQAMSTGVIDATDYTTLAQNFEVGLHSSAKYALYPGIHSNPTLELSINLETWKKLPDDLKAILEVAARRAANDLIMESYVMDQEAMAIRAPKEGVTIIDWTQEERTKLRKVATEVMKEYAKESPAAQRVYDTHIAFMKRIGLIR